MNVCVFVELSSLQSLDGLVGVSFGAELVIV